MIKSIVIKFTKKYIKNGLNDLLNKNKDNVHKITSVIGIWIQRLENIIKCLKNIIQRLSDCTLDDEEIKQSQNEIESIINEW